MVNIMPANSELDLSEPIAIIDGHAVAFYSWFSDYPRAVVPGVIRKLSNILKEYSPSHLILTFDPPPPTFRHELYSAYKGNRPPVPEGFLEECEELFGVLNSMGIPFYEVPFYEADDLIGTVVEQLRGSGRTTVIFTSDLDLLQLIVPGVNVEVFSQYWPTRLFDKDTARRRFGGLEPQYIPDFKALAGDRSDNLPGVKGIGEVSATAVLRDKLNLEGIYENLDSISDLSIRGSKRLIKLLQDNESQAFEMRKLATIVKNVPLNIDWQMSECNGFGEEIDRYLKNQRMV